MSDDRLIVALDVPNVVQGLDWQAKLGMPLVFIKSALAC